MTLRSVVILFLAALLVSCAIVTAMAPACCPAPPPNIPVVNADQTVIIIWDAARQTQHFIRKASFESDAEDFGFIVPTPNQPELEESGGDAFPLLAKLTEPEVKYRRRLPGLGCATHFSAPPLSRSSGVTVLEKKEVAGFNATVLEAKSSDSLVAWLKDNGYAYSAAVEAWARPYVEQGWKFTALKIAKDRAAKTDKAVDAAALRISFKTDRPLFPYREPDPKAFAQTLGVKQRLLRIYFLAEARYRGELTRASLWTGKAVWAGTVSDESRKSLLAALKLPADTAKPPRLGSLGTPSALWLTEFEDRWPYQAAPADLYFCRDPNQRMVRREPVIQYVSNGWPADGSIYTLAGVLILPPLIRRIRRRKVVAAATN